ncbi:MAG: CrcB family protein [Thermoleophilia bacterium]
MPAPRPGPALAAAIALGGAAGACLRFGVDEIAPVEPGRWPWATLIVNLAGAALLGYLATLLRDAPARDLRRPLLGTGLCGALTTFSTLQVEVIALGRDGHAGLGAAYLAVSVAAGLACVTAGGLVARR